VKALRTLLLWTHLALGLSAAVVLAIVAITGAYITFQVPLERWLTPIPPVASVPDAPDLAAFVATVERELASERVAQVEVRRNGDATIAALRNQALVFIDPIDGSILGVRERSLFSIGTLTRAMRVLHTNLLLGRRGHDIVIIATLECLLLAASGLWLWWRRKHWRFAWKGSPFRVSWDLHNATGIWFLLPVVVIAVTGLLLPYPGIAYRMAGVTAEPWRALPTSGEPGMAGSEPMSLASVLAVADSALPGPTESLTIPGGPRGSYGVRKATHSAFVDQYTGRLIGVEPNNANHPVLVQIEHAHTGALFGIAGRAVWTVASLMLALMTVTGVLLGWKRLMITFGRWRADASP
jgi:sulfite reductase (NADPH) flavoprotein alpha-component